MVAHQQRRAFIRDGLQVAMLHAVHGMAEQPDHEAHGELGDDFKDVSVNRDVEQRHHQEQLGDRQLGHAQQQDRNDGRNHHEQCIEDVVGGDHPSPFVLGGARLDQRIQRHDVKAAEHTQAEDIKQHPPRLAIAEHREPIVGLHVLREAAGVPPQKQAEYGQAKRAKRHQADFHLTPGEFFAQHRAQGDAHREHREDQGHHGFIAVQPFLGIGRDLREVDRADKPEP